MVEARNRIDTLLGIQGSRTVDSFHRALGAIMWNKCGMSRTREGLNEAIEEIRSLRNEFWNDVRVVGTADYFNQNLEQAGRVADFMEFSELLCQDALHREESCGGHFREEFQTPEGEALRDDENFAYVAAWQFTGENAPAQLHKEQLSFKDIPLATRSYK